MSETPPIDDMISRTQQFIRGVAITIAELLGNPLMGVAFTSEAEHELDYYLSQSEECPVCHQLTWRLSCSATGDLDVCYRCWERSLDDPEVRAQHHCADCGKWIDGMYHYTFFAGHMMPVISACHKHFEARMVAPAPPHAQPPMNVADMYALREQLNNGSIVK